MASSVLQTIWSETYDLWGAVLGGVGGMFTKVRFDGGQES